MSVLGVNPTVNRFVKDRLGVKPTTGADNTARAGASQSGRINFDDFLDYLFSRLGIDT
jgi:hypothetical protein